jgi:holliday junction DNA helicase RuvA
MIARLAGRVAEKLEDRVVLDVNGVGYEILAPGSTLSRVGPVGTALTLHTVLHVREDALTLFGFITIDEKKLFESVTAVTGIGPKLGLSILSALSPADFRRAVVENDLSALTGVSGIGRKTAQRLVVELRDSLSLEPMPAGAEGVGPSIFQDAVTALVTLGYPRATAVRAVRQVLDGSEPLARVEDVVRRALGQIATR